LRDSLLGGEGKTAGCITRFAFALALAALAAGCGEQPANPRGIPLADCHLTGIAQTLQCGSIEVPENRAQPDGRKIRIAVTLLPANTLSPKADPLFMLAGGPGQAASSIVRFAAQLTEVRATRDIVLIDQRGTGRSSPLACKAFAPEHDLAAALAADPLMQAKDCIAELTQRGVDATQYTTAAFIEDLEDARRALGYARINLWGGSYGTRVAQRYLRAHPAVIRSAVLDGVVPPAMSVFDAFPAQRKIIASIIAQCLAAAACQEANPDLAGALAAIQRDLGVEGKQTAIALPQTGRVIEARLRWPAVMGSVQMLAYQPESAALIPPVLTAAARGDYAPLIGAMSLRDGSDESQIDNALYYTVTCSEDAPRLSTEQRAAALADPLTRELAADLFAVCDAWPRGAVPNDDAAPLTSDTPVLLLSGGLDPVTPPDHAATVVQTLPHGKTITAPGFGHIVSSRACGPQLIARFIDRAGFASLPAACVNFFEGTAPPPVWMDTLGPSAAP
jgi:pimeloyl-ACP methyl ester carboxylesterase